MVISAIFAFVILPGLLLFQLFEEQKREKPRFFCQWGIVLLLGGLGGLACCLSAAVRSIAPFELINRERRLFWELFAKELEKNDSFTAAAEAMNFNLPEVENFILGIAFEFLCSGIFLISVALVLLAAAVVMMVKSRKKKVAPWLLTVTVASACVFGVWGGHNCFFSRAIKDKLTWWSVLQTKTLEECVREKKGEFRSNKEIAALLPQYLKETPGVFGESWERLEKIFYAKTFETKKE